jgi:hypothetical protein
MSPDIRPESFSADTLPADAFWAAYSEGAVAELERHPGRDYRGKLDTDPDGRDFVVSWPALVRYDYQANPQFSLGVHTRLGRALRTVIGARLMRQDTRPHRAQLWFVLELLGRPQKELSYQELREYALEELARADIPPERAVAALQQRLPDEARWAAYQNDGDVAYLAMEREVVLKAFGLLVTDSRVCRALMSVVENHAREDVVTVGLALWALGRLNDKDAIPFLIRLLADPRFGYHTLEAERALQLLCSGGRMIPLSSGGEAPREYWERAAAPLQRGADDWARVDAASVFWEKRLRRARAWVTTGGQPAELAALRDDEVEPVRRAISPVPILMILSYPLAYRQTARAHAPPPGPVNGESAEGSLRWRIEEEASGDVVLRFGSDDLALRGARVRVTLGTWQGQTEFRQAAPDQVLGFLRIPVADRITMPEGESPRVEVHPVSDSDPPVSG